MSSARLNLPFLSSGQAQKEITHNEALLLLDIITQATCRGEPSNVPPDDVALGDTFICGPEPTGAWAGRRDALACWTEGGWRFVDAFEGLKVTAVESGRTRQFREGKWQAGRVYASELLIDGQRVVGARRAAVQNPTGGSTIDAEARRCLIDILDALRAHGLVGA